MEVSCACRSGGANEFVLKIKLLGGVIKPIKNKMDGQLSSATLQEGCLTGPMVDRCADREPIPMASPGENKIREIVINELNRGFIVRVGCHTFAISTKAELTGKLIEYINEPLKTEQKWFGGKLF